MCGVDAMEEAALFVLVQMPVGILARHLWPFERAAVELSRGGGGYVPSLSCVVLRLGAFLWRSSVW